jgi:predicted permease
LKVAVLEADYVGFCPNMTLWIIARRILRHKPQEIALALFILAISVTAATAVLSAATKLAIGQLPWATTDHVIAITALDARDHLPKDLAPADFITINNQARSIDRCAAWVGISRSLRGGSYPELLHGVAASESLFSILSIHPLAGGIFSNKDRGVMLISEGVWREQLSGKSSAIGQILTLDGHPFQIVGVVPQSSSYPQGVDFWIPLNSFESFFALRGVPLFSVIALRRQNIGLDTIQKELNLILSRDRSNDSGKLPVLAVTPFRQMLFGDYKPRVLVLLTATILLLVAGCINIGTIFLARFIGRSRELSIQMMLGATQGQLRRQFVYEGMIVSCGAGCLALLAMPISNYVLHFMLPSEAFNNTAVDWRIFGLVAVISLSCGVLCASIPIFLGLNRFSTFSTNGSKSSLLPRLGMGWKGLVAAEIAIAVGLCVASGLLVKSFFHLSQVQLGFDSDNVVSIRLNLSGVRYGDNFAKIAILQNLLQKLQLLPGVKAVGAATSVPLGGGEALYDIELPSAAESDEKVSGVNTAIVTGDYFRVLGIALRRGRFFIDSDGSEGPHVCLINEAFAKEYLAGVEPLGLVVTVGGGRVNYQIVGIVGDMRSTSISEPPRPALFLRYEQAPWAGIDLIAHTSSDPKSVVDAMRKVIKTVDPDLAFGRITTLSHLLDASMFDRRVRTAYMSAFSLVCMCLAGIGLYGVITYTAKNRQKELAVRLALGARKTHIFQQVLTWGRMPIVAGLIGGALLSIWFGHLLSALLYGTWQYDPLTLLLVLGVLGLLAMASMLNPAWKATAIDPIRLLGPD